MPAGHREFVESWLRRRAGTASAQLLAAQALSAVWERAQRSLSELALRALGRCALDAAAREFPLLADARLGPRGFELPPAESEVLLPALGGLLVEFLSLVAETSGTILAPALEAELLRVGGGRWTPPQGVRPLKAQEPALPATGARRAEHPTEEPALPATGGGRRAEHPTG